MPGPVLSERQVWRDDVHAVLGRLMCEPPAARTVDRLHCQPQQPCSAPAKRPAHLHPRVLIRASPPRGAGWLHFQYQADCRAANPTYGYATNYGCNNNWGNIGCSSCVADFSQIGSASWADYCYMRIFPPPPPPAGGSDTSSPVYQAMSPTGYMCQGWYVNMSSYDSISAEDCQALCSESIYCGATTFQEADQSEYRYYSYCARDTARPLLPPDRPARPSCCPATPHCPAAYPPTRSRIPSSQATCTTKSNQSASWTMTTSRTIYRTCYLSHHSKDLSTTPVAASPTQAPAVPTATSGMRSRGASASCKSSPRVDDCQRILCTPRTTTTRTMRRRRRRRPTPCATARRWARPSATTTMGPPGSASPAAMSPPALATNGACRTPAWRTARHVVTHLTPTLYRTPARTAAEPNPNLNSDPNANPNPTLTLTDRDPNPKLNPSPEPSPNPNLNPSPKPSPNREHGQVWCGSSIDFSSTSDIALQRSTCYYRVPWSPPPGLPPPPPSPPSPSPPPPPPCVD